MNRKLFSLLTAGVFALLSSCGDSVVDVNTPTPEDPASSPVQTKASLSVVVQDNSTGKPIDGATVSLPLAGKTVTTVDGTAIFDSLTTGEYEVRISAAGYAPVITGAYVDNRTAENIYVAQSSALAVSLYPTTAKLSGTIYYADINGANKPATGTPVALIINEYIYDVRIADNRTITTTVGADGKYEFTGLPAIANGYYRLLTLEATLDGVVYGSQSICTSCGNLVANDVVYQDNKILSINTIDELFIVLSYSNYIANTAPVVIAFSSPVDLRKIKENTVTLNSGVTGADFKWNGIGDTLTITPAGKWNSGFNVNLSNLVSTNDKYLSGTNNPYINVNQEDISAKQVSGLKLSNTTVIYTSNSAGIEWNKVDGATGYKIYRKTINDDGYVYVNETNGVNDTTITISFNSSQKNYYNYDYGQETSGNVIKYDTVSFIVQAYNGSSKTSLAGADELEIYAKPTVSTYNGDPKINSNQVVKFGYNDWNGGTQYYSYSASYIYALDDGGAFGTPYSYYPSASGLDSAQFGYFSDLAYYLAQTAAFAGYPKNWNGNSYGATGIEDDLIAGCTMFNEPMDITVTPTITGVPNTRVTVNTFWSETTSGSSQYYSERILCYNVKVAAATTTAPVSTADINSTISISGLKSKAGIPLEINYNGIRKNTLDFKIKSIGYKDPS